MTTENILWIIAISIIALLVAIFQYFFKAKRRSKKTILFAFLRFLSVFIILLLLVNPEITIIKSNEQKPELKILVDQSQSIKHLKQQEQLKNIVPKIANNTEIQKKFEVFTYGFGEQITDSVTFNFKETQTIIQQSILNIQKIHKGSNNPIILLTDGNQTYGKDYTYYKSKHQQPIYAIAVGDTTRVADLQVTTVNANKYVYLDNEFPIEILVNYSGKDTCNTDLTIYRGKQKIYNEKISFNAEKRSYFITPKLKASIAGLQNYKIVLNSFTEEKNKTNNSKNILIETIDEKASVLLVSTVTHPDIGALKRNIESNKRRRLKVVKPTEINSLDNIALVILYQPNNSFKKVYELCTKVKMPLLTITGKQTDWNFLNALQRNYTKANRTQVEEVLPVLNSNFGIFNTNQFVLEKYPPLESAFGDIQITSDYEILMYKKVAGVITAQPLLAFLNSSNTNEALLFGEGIWKWRLMNYKRDGNFEKFDDFFGKIIQYLSNKKARKRLIVNYNNEYFTNSPIVISASYFNKNYEFDVKAQLVISIQKEGETSNQKIPMLLKGSFYEADIKNLEAGNYNFLVEVKGSKLKSNGSFVIQNFDIEKQFQTPNIDALEQLTLRNNGKLIYPNQVNNLVDELVNSENYKSTITYSKEQKPLINWKILLGLLAILFSMEWFLRKYHGLI